MELLILLLIFAIIAAGIGLKKPLYLSMGLAAAVGFLFYGVPVAQLPHILHQGVLGQSTINMVLAFYTITFLQRMLEKRQRLTQAEKAITRLFGSRRVNAMFTPFVVGMMPSAGAVLIAAPIVDRAAGEALSRDERMFVSSFYRHISEAFLPTYANILLALQLSGVKALPFLIGMTPMVLALFALGYVFYVRKIPKVHAGEEAAATSGRQAAFMALFRSLWSIFAAVLLILLLPLPIFLVVLGVIIMNIFVERFSWQELKPMFRSALEIKLIVNTVFIMIFKEVLLASGALHRLPTMFAGLPVPEALLYALMMLLGAVIAGTQAMAAIVIPLAFTAGPDLPLLVLLMSTGYMAAQVSPPHICLTIVAEYYRSSLAALVRKTLPVLAAFSALALAYYYLLRLI
ncbi:MAG: DUF401 family protein [Christensenellales bacterium]